LKQELEALKGHDVTVFTFSKPEQDLGVKVVANIPKKIPLFGIYQEFFMPTPDLDKMDVVVANSCVVKTSKPLIVYDQNQMANNFTGKMSSKYDKGFWKLYATPYKIIKKFSKLNQKAQYYSCSQYSANALQNAVGVKCDVLYPGIPNDTFVHSKVPQVCVMGRIAQEKNLEQAIEIMNPLDCVCVIAGSVDRQNQPYLKKLKDMANTNIIFVENPTRPQFLAIMAESRVYLSASHETLGLTTIEAINSGCIPVVPDNSAHPETVPIQDLRYNSNSYARDVILEILDGLHPDKLDILTENAKQFTNVAFTMKFNNIIAQPLVFITMVIGAVWLLTEPYESIEQACFDSTLTQQDYENCLATLRDGT
jgi:glycosyltransferase involved in cell wall biosynthesis